MTTTYSEVYQSRFHQVELHGHLTGLPELLINSRQHLDSELDKLSRTRGLFEKPMHTIVIYTMYKASVLRGFREPYGRKNSPQNIGIFWFYCSLVSQV